MESCQSMKIQSKIIEKERVLFYYNHVYNFYFRYFIKLGLMEQPNIQQTDQSTLMTINENRHDDFKPKSRTTESEHEVEIPVSKVQQSISNFGNSENSRQNEQGEAPEVENVKLQQMEIQKQEMSDDSEEEKSGIVVKSGRERKFKRSTNNSHKKFVSVARRWLFKNNISTLKVAFQTKYNAFRSTRTYFFIILAFIKTVMDVQKQKQFQEFFFKLVSKKIGDYQKQIQNTENPNLKHFRQDEITDLKYSIKACDVYFQGDMDKSIQCVYKKDKISIVKKQHYEEALKTVKGIEQELLQPGSFQKMIAEFGKKKQKRTSSNQSNLSGEKQQDYMRHMFLFPEMFGISDGLNFKQIVETCKKPQLDKMTEECQEEEKQQISFQLKDRTQQIASKLEFSSSQGKIKKNIIILHPQLENKQTKLFQGLQIKSESMAFKPFQKQPQVESTNLN